MIELWVSQLRLMNFPTSQIKNHHQKSMQHLESLYTFLSSFYLVCKSEFLPISCVTSLEIEPINSKRPDKERRRGNYAKAINLSSFFDEDLGASSPTLLIITSSTVS